MKNRLIRISITLLAIAVGIMLTILFIFTGDKAKGPVEDLMDNLSKTTLSIDKYFSSKDEREKRAHQLQWFDRYRDSVPLLINPDTILLGAYDNTAQSSLEPIVELEQTIDVKLPFIHIYTAWGSKAVHDFPFRKCVAIHELGSMPIITWEPWLIDFSVLEYPELGPKDNRDKGGLQAIANGKYDFYINNWLHEIKSYGHPVFLRFGHEMNDPYRYPWGPQNNAPQDFIAAWRYVHDYFKKEGVNNVIWVWSPHIAYEPIDEYYPGKKYVDWIGIGVLNYGSVAPWSRWWSFKEIFSDRYSTFKNYNKPIMISEFGSLVVGGNRPKWFRNAFREIDSRHPLVQSVIFFNSHSDNTTTSKSLDWSFQRDTATIKAIKEGIEDWAS